MSNNDQRSKDTLNRVPGTFSQSLPGFAIWYLGRAIDAPFQYLLFSRGWVVKALSAIGLHGNSALLKVGPGAGGLGPVPTLLTGMYAAAAVRHCHWITFTNTYQWPIGQATGIVLNNLVMHIIITLGAIRAITSSNYVVAESFIDVIGWKQWAGVGLFITGMFMEILAEESRKHFKANPSNNGNIDDTGLWSIVRHPNYAGYTLLHIGLMLAGGSVGGTIGIGIFTMALFVSQSIPGLSGHMSDRYGEQWTAYKKRVPYKLFPGIL